MSTSTASSDLRQGIAAARNGHRLLARLHLAEAIDADPSNDAHWLWMAWVAESPTAAVSHLQKALEHNPGNEIAKAGLIWAQTMSEWDFARPLSPRATLAAVAEREARTAPVEAVAEPAAVEAAEQAPAEELHVQQSLLAEDASPQQEPPADAVAPVESVAPAAAMETPPVLVKPPSHQFSRGFDPNRPESLPIDYMTGMFTGEGGQAVGDQFAGFNMAMDSVDVVNDPSASLATPFPGGMTVGKIAPTRPPSADLATPFGGYDPGELREPGSTSDSEFETITPTKLGEAAATDSPIEVHAEAAAEVEAKSAPAAEDFAASNAEIHSQADIAVEEPPVEHGASDQESSEGRPRKVLIVDDSPTVCKIVSITLKKRGFDVSSAGDGVEAMALVASNRPDLILLDITMPRMDGYQLCKLIKGYPETKNIPVIMLSGKDGFFDRVRGKLVGCSDYVTKPFDPELLVATVERFLPAPLAAAAS